MLQSQAYPILAPNEVDLIHHKEVNVLDVLALLPPPGEDVPLLRGTDDDVAFAQKLQVCAGLPCQQHYLLVEPVLKFLIPVHVHLTDREGDIRTVGPYVHLSLARRRTEMLERTAALKPYTILFVCFEMGAQADHKRFCGFK